jgi:hypothetical protein
MCWNLPALTACRRKFDSTSSNRPQWIAAAAECLLLAQSGHLFALRRCPLSGVAVLLGIEQSQIIQRLRDKGMIGPKPKSAGWFTRLQALRCGR